MADQPLQITDTQPDIVESESYNRIDVEKAYKLRVTNGLSYAAIGAQLGVSAQAVWRRLKIFHSVLQDPSSLKVYQGNEADVVDSVRMKMLPYLVDEDKLKKAHHGNLVWGFAKLGEYSRLLKGQSTTNVSQLTTIIEGAHAHKKGKDMPAQVQDVVDVPTDLDKT